MLFTHTLSSLQVLLGKLTSYMSLDYCKIHKQFSGFASDLFFFFFFSLADYSDYSPQLELTFSTMCNSEWTQADTAGVENG